MGFRSLQHLRDRRSTYRRPCQGPLRSARRVWLPSRRLTPSEPAPVLFHTGSALGIRPSELSPPGRYPPRFRAEGPTYRFARRCSRRFRDGPAQRAAVPGLLPFQESLAAERMISAPSAGCSLGLRPSRVSWRRPCTGLHPRSSHALRSRPPCGGHTRVPRSFDQPSPGPVLVAAKATPRTRQPLWGSRTGTHPTVRAKLLPEL